MIQNIFIGPQTLGHSLGFPRKEFETKVYAQALNAEWDTASGVKEREHKQKKSGLVKGYIIKFAVSMK